MRRIRNKSAEDLAIAAGIGAVAGLRSMTAPAMVALAINQGRLRAPKGRLDFLDNNKTAAIIGSLAFGELIVDKLPWVPNRTSPPALTGRILAGGFAGAALFGSKRRPIIAGAVFGGLGAVAGSFLGYYARKQITQKLHAKDTLVAVVEDAIAVVGGDLLAA